MGSIVRISEAELSSWLQLEEPEEHAAARAALPLAAARVELDPATVARGGADAAVSAAVSTAVPAAISAPLVGAGHNQSIAGHGGKGDGSKAARHSGRSHNG